MGTGAKSEYVPLTQEDHEKQLGDDDHKSPQSPTLRHINLNIFFLCLHALAFVTYSAIFYANYVHFEKSYEKRSTLWSPALPIIKYGGKTIEGKIFYENEYRGIPSTDIDNAWRRISMSVPALRVFENELELLNRSTTRNYHKLPEESGGGYLAMLEVFHLLHCLDALRKVSYHEYYPEFASEADDPIKRRVHTGHCIDILRLHIMCTSDVVPIVFYDDPSQEAPLPDFSTMHTCRNFEDILDWSYDNERTVQWDEIGVVEH